jgi:hypothetical protein
MTYDRRNKFLGHAFVKYKLMSLHQSVIKNSNLFSLKGRKVVISEKLEKIVTLEDIEKRCWFCFKNPNLDTDLVLKEKIHFYVAYPKGPIDNFHFLILPKNHIKSFIDLDKTQKEEFIEIIKTLINIINDNKLDHLIYEKNLPYNDEAAKHMVINVVGIKSEFSFNFIEVMKNILNNNKLKFKEFDMKYSLTEMVNKNSHYYYIDAPTGIQFGRSAKRTKILIDPSNTHKDFIDYPRMIICSLIDKEERLNWKNADINKEFLVGLKDKTREYFK